MPSHQFHQFRDVFPVHSLPLMGTVHKWLSIMIARAHHSYRAGPLPRGGGEACGYPLIISREISSYD